MRPPRLPAPPSMGGGFGGIAPPHSEGELGDGLDAQPDAEEEEQRRRRRRRWPSPAAACRGRGPRRSRALRSHHAERGAEPRAEPAVVGGEGDRGQHRLVAGLGQEEGGADGDDRPLAARLTFSFSSSVRLSPCRVQNPKARKASAATRLIHPVGSAAPRPNPMPTDARCTTAVAIVMPMSTGHTLKRVAKVRAMSWDLSPSSATKMTPKETSVLMRTASTDGWGLSRSGRGRRETSTRQHAAWVEGLARLAGGAARPDIGRRTGVRQYVDRDIGGYSPSLPQDYRGAPPPQLPDRDRRLTRDL